ncbi:MAG: PKD domain-containing protein [Bacteroidales bacterium]|nr:PKD domain-containing protein [Bacteroidales bacterium]MCF8455311.1 PKD domain-containing protein [Bacteroidales bacterium]
MKKIYLLFLLFGVFSMTSRAQVYCTASGNMDEHISNVVVGSISNPSLATPYSDFTNLSTDMIIGESYAAVITNGQPYGSDQCGIWVDWNQDYDFTDPGEFYATSGSPGFGPYSADIIPPDSAQLGPTRMRIRIIYSGMLQPCGVTSFGEVEDYTINVLPNCQANAVFNFFDLGLAVDFVAPHNYDTTLYFLSWNLGDGTTIANQSIFTHTYSMPGNYEVSLLVNDLNDSTCFDNYIDTLYLDSCEANAEFDFVVDELNVEFHSHFQYDTTMYEVSWNMGDGTIIQGGDSLSYTYSIAGIYPVSLTIINLSDTLCQNTVGYDVEPWECDIQADFTFQIMGYNVSFSAPYNTGDYILNWDFGDGATANNNPTVSHYYSLFGTYTATLTLTDPLHPSCIDSISYPIVINNCYANAAFTSDPFGQDVNFHATTTYSFGYTFIWDYGDGNIDTAGTNVSHTFPSIGSYTVELTVVKNTDSTCTDVESNVITLDSCLAKANFSIIKDQLSVDFLPTYPIDSTNYIITWDFGDGASATNLLNPNHVYGSEGTYQVSMVITNLYDTACTDTFSLSLTVQVCNADAEFTVTDNGNDNYDFTLLNGPATGYNVFWSFSDGTTAYNVNSVNKTITNLGAYSATAIVSNWSIPNCSDTFAYVLCDINANFNTYKNGMEVSFNTIIPYNIMGYYTEWYFGDGTSLMGTNYATHTYASEDTYTVTCIVTSINYPSCTDTVIMDVYVAECYVFADFDYQIDSTTVTFTTTYSIGQYNFYWDFGDGTTQIAVPNIVHTYALTGDYEVCLILVDPANSNCSDTTCYILSVYPYNLAANDPLADGISLFPNPVDDMLSIEFFEEKATSYRMTIFTATGQKVISEMLQSKSGENTYSIDVSRLPSGIYYIALKADEKTSKNLKFVK